MTDELSKENGSRNCGDDLRSPTLHELASFLEQSRRKYAASTASGIRRDGASLNTTIASRTRGSHSATGSRNDDRNPCYTAHAILAGCPEAIHREYAGDERGGDLFDR